MEFALFLVLSLCGAIFTELGVYIALGVAVVTIFGAVLGRAYGKTWLFAVRSFTGAAVLVLAGVAVTVAYVLSQPW